jgi:membrane associated rhomboid family serine protease
VTGTGHPVDDWVAVFSSRRRHECHERGLVLDAVGIPNTIVDGPSRALVLLVPGRAAEEARRELDHWEHENRSRDTSGPLPPFRPVDSGVPLATAWIVLLLAAFYAQVTGWQGVDFVAAGGLDGAAVRGGEWWRVVTALTLHGDAAHVLANIGFGAFFVVYAAQYLGSGAAGLLVLAAAAAGNAMDVLLLPPTHRAIGASTAVFAALGVVAAWVWMTQTRRAVGWARRYAPLVGGVMLLAWIGTGDEKTDVVAHLTGFVAGLAAGAWAGWHGPAAWALTARLQASLGGVALAVVALAWIVAVSAAPRNFG